MREKKENTKMLQVRVSPDLHYKVKEMSLKRGKAIQEILIELIIKEVKTFRGEGSQNDI